MIGHLGADVETKTFNGKVFYAINVAHSSNFLNSETGNVEEKTTWVSATMNWDIQKLKEYLTRGTRVYIRGNLTTRIYTGHDGEKHAGLNVIISEIELC